MEYKEQADSKVLKKCKNFILENSNKEGDYQVFREALKLCNELITSLLASQEEFNKAIKAELAKKPANEEGPEMDAFIYKFNNKKLMLKLDVDAHKVLDELEIIKKNNRKINF